MKTTIRVLIAEESQLYRLGIKTVLQRRQGIAVIAETASAAAVLGLVKEHQPDIVLLDPQLSGVQAADIARHVSMGFPDTHIIVLSDSTSKEGVLEFIHAGARGYVLKRSSKEELLDAIYAVAGNLPYYAPEVASLLLQHIGHRRFMPAKAPCPSALFTQTELQIIELICRQHTTKEISYTLHLGTRTIEGYRTRIEEKMNVRNTAGVVIYAITWQLFVLGSSM